MDRLLRQRAQLGDQVGKQQHRRREMSVRDIGMIDIHMLVHPRHILGNTHQIGRPQGKFGKKPVGGKGGCQAVHGIHYDISLRNLPMAARKSLT